MIIRLKDDTVFLLNAVEITLNKKPTKFLMEKRKYKELVSEYKKRRTLIKKVIWRSITVLKK